MVDCFLAFHVRVIATTLVACVDQCSRATAILEFFTNRSNDHVRRQLRDLDLFSNSARLTAFNRYCLSLRGADSSLRQQLERFLDSHHHDQAISSVAVRIAAVDRLASQLRTHKEELADMARSPVDRALLSRLIWFLISNYCAASCNDRALSLQVAVCLGELGCVEPLAVAFSDSRRGAQLDALASPETQPDIDPATSHDAPQLPLYGAILRSLAAFLVDTDPNVIEQASSCLTAILETTQGVAALAKLDALTKNYIIIFQPSSSSATATSGTAAAPPAPASPLSARPPGLSDRELWSPQCSASLAEWICRLTCTLAEHAVDPILRLCAPMARLKSSLAESLFPHVLLDHALRSTSQTTLAECMGLYVLSPDNTNSESVRLVLKAINLLRLRLTRQLLREKQQQQGSRQRRGTAQSPMLFWRDQKWIQIDPLLLASAAQRCSAYLTSLLYLEVWQEEAFGELSLRDESATSAAAGSRSTESAAVSVGGRASSRSALPNRATHDTKRKRWNADMHQLLLNCFANINDPDTLTGIGDVDADAEVATRMAMYEQLGQWTVALGSYDALLQQQQHVRQRQYSQLLHHDKDDDDESFSRTPSTSSIMLHRSRSPTPLSSGPRIELDLGLLRALRLSGQYHLWEY